MYLKSSVFLIFIEQFRVFAYDLGTPRRNSTNAADVFINVIRNNFSPQFINTPYSVNIAETVPGGSSIFQTTAIDQDTNVGHF